jgi:hypothetical protein
VILAFEDRIPPPSPEVIGWMEQFGGENPLELERGMQALAAALERPGRIRDGAFALLAADGLLTYAVEVAARASNPEIALRKILIRVSEAI